MKEQLPPQKQDTLARRGLDNDTVQYGVEGPYEDWEHDHTSLVHVLWHAKHSGLSLDEDYDTIATLIMQSRWLAAQKSQAPGNNPETSREYRVVPRVRQWRDKIRFYQDYSKYRAFGLQFSRKHNKHEYRDVGKWTEIPDE